MKAETISVIRTILIQKRENAYRDYKALRQKLEQKYETGWFNDKLTDYERKALVDFKEEFYKIKEISEDFENHQW